MMFCKFCWLDYDSISHWNEREYRQEKKIMMTKCYVLPLRQPICPPKTNKNLKSYLCDPYIFNDQLQSNL